MNDSNENSNCICFACLTNTDNLSVVFFDNIENEILIQVQYVLPEINIWESGNTVYICSSCNNTLRFFCTFKKICLDNYNLLKLCTNEIQDANATTLNSMSSEMNPETIINNNLLMQRNQNDNIILNDKVNESTIPEPIEDFRFSELLEFPDKQSDEQIVNNTINIEETLISKYIQELDFKNLESDLIFDDLLTLPLNTTEDNNTFAIEKINSSAPKTKLSCPKYNTNTTLNQISNEMNSETIINNNMLMQRNQNYNIILNDKVNESIIPEPITDFRFSELFEFPDKQSDEQIVNNTINIEKTLISKDIQELDLNNLDSEPIFDDLFTLSLNTTEDNNTFATEKINSSAPKTKLYCPKYNTNTTLNQMSNDMNSETIINNNMLMQPNQNDNIILNDKVNESIIQKPIEDFRFSELFEFPDKRSDEQIVNNTINIEETLISKDNQELKFENLESEPVSDVELTLAINSITDNNTDAQDKINPSASKKKFCCTKCNKEFSRNILLKSHIKKHLGIKEFECAICHKKFIEKCNLKKHIKAVHCYDTKDFECTICKKMFKSKDILKTHISKHKFLGNYECTTCQKNFKGYSNVKAYANLHKGVKDFECSSCFEKNHKNA